MLINNGQQSLQNPDVNIVQVQDVTRAQSHLRCTSIWLFHSRNLQINNR